MIYWKAEKFWLGKLLEHPEIMTQGETLEELEENIKEAYLLMIMDDVPAEYEMKEIVIWKERSLLDILKARGATFCDMVEDMISISTLIMVWNNRFRDIRR